MNRREFICIDNNSVIKGTGQWEVYRTNAGFALYSPDGDRFCWEWDISDNDVVLVLQRLNDGEEIKDGY